MISLLAAFCAISSRSEHLSPRSFGIAVSVFVLWAVVERDGIRNPPLSDPLPHREFCGFFWESFRSRCSAAPTR
jgi:hypothetical protein